ncbi:MAG: DUF2029 domain-containing protein [Chloroflexota bacterium]|nr:DUF2029 domain-containing protein [Chloroflexota bacterium]
MRSLLRVAAIAAAGAALFEAGSVNGAVELRPSPGGAIFAAVAVVVALALLAAALAGTGGDAAAPPDRSLAPAMRVIFVVVSGMALFGLAWLRGIPSPIVNDFTPYHNDAIALNECAAQALLRGQDPYRPLDLFACYGARRIGPDRTTPLQAGAFSDVTVYPSLEQMDAAWSADAAACARDRSACAPTEFVSRLSYPALSVLLVLPWVALGWDTNVLYVLCLVAAVALVLVRAPAASRAFLLTGVLAAASVTAFTVGGSADLLYALPLVAAWLWRERRWSALALGCAAAVKQLAWPFALFYLLQVAARDGWREAARRAAIAGALFALVDAPFVAWDARAFLAGILTPLAAPMFARGTGLVTLAANGAAPFLSPSAYLALEAIALAVALAVAWRARHASPELGAVLAMFPLYFAWRSLFSYFFLLPLFAAAGVARMPLGDLDPETARESGAFTVLALPPRAERAAAK